MKKYLYIIGLTLSCSLSVMAQQTVTGVVKDASGNPLSGVKVSKVGEFRHSAVTDQDGVFSLEVEKGDYVELNYTDLLMKRVKVEGETLNVVLDGQKDEAKDLGFMKRTEEGQTQSVSAIFADDFYKNATSVTKMNNSVFGLLSGLNLTQNIGWDANADWRVRGQGGLAGAAPLIIVDGFRRALDNLTLEEIESVQVLKDGAATALWGTRGANGVVLINTKRGKYNSFDIDINYRHGFELPINEIEMADAYTYAMAQNEALYYDGLPLQYTQHQLDQYKNGSNPYFYPNVNWYEEGTRNFSENNEFNIALRGGGSRVRYLALLDYKNAFGLLNDDWAHYNDRMSTQIRSYELRLRMNLDVDITSSTKMKFNLFGTITEDKEPNTAVNTIFQNFYKVPAAAFPIRTINDNWGGNTVFGMNPIAQIADVGYVQENQRLLYGDMRLVQDFSMFLKGLSAEVAVGYDNSATFRDVTSKEYMYEVSYLSDAGLPVSNTYGNNTELQLETSNSARLNKQILRVTFEGKVNYDRTFDDHQLAASVIYRQESEEGLTRGTSYYRQNVMGILGYNYKNRYMADVVANYQGTSVLTKGDKFRFYPAVSVGWNMANEAFMEDASAVDMLKLRASWGRSAYDNATSYGLGYHFWTGSGTYYFGDGNGTSVSGLREQRIPVAKLNLETADKYNIGIDARLWENLTATAEFYYDHRKDILVTNNLVSDMLGVTAAQSNLGEVKSKGVELSLGWNDRIKSHDFSYYVNANWAWNGSEVVEDGQAFQPYDYLYTKGHKVGQLFGLEAIGYFRDEADIANSPTQTFSTVRPGDIKYKDQNGDNQINSEDRVAIGKSTTVPEMVMGLNLGFEYKGFGVDLNFQGVTGITQQLTAVGVHRPLRNGNNNVSMWYLRDNVRWTESTKDIANLPRLSTLSNNNNYQTSTQWIEDGSFFKLRNLNVYYTLPQKWSEKMKMDKFTIYARAQNVFSIDKIDYFNCEDITLGYPDVFSVCLGLNINF